MLILLIGILTTAVLLFFFMDSHGNSLPKDASKLQDIVIEKLQHTS